MTFATLAAARIRAARLTVLAVAVLAIAPLPAAAQGADKAPPMTAEALAVKKTLEQKFPGGDIRGVVKTPYFGLYEVQFDDRVLYTDAKVKYLLVGSVYDTESKTNLTEDRQRKLNRVDVSKLPLDLAIKKVKGTGERKLVVFSDADCPFCAKLEQELKTVDNVTIYTYLFPIDQLHPDAARKSRAIWCAPDRQQAWDAFFESGTVPDNKGDCGDPIAQTAELGARYKVTATPTLVFADGSIVPGAIPASRIDAELKSADAEVKKLAAVKK
jgi:thiol:disulfide interchange protein DsbC